MDLPFFDSLERAIDTLERDHPNARVVLVNSGGERTFCAGGDIAALETLDEASMPHWVERGHAVLARLEALPLPVIAVVHGHALGGGLELALACDIIVATEHAKLGQTECRLGFVSGWGGSLRLLRRVGLPRAKLLFFSGTVLTAGQALEWGVADIAGPDAEAELEALVRQITENEPKAVSLMKKIITELDSGDLARCVALERDHSVDAVRNPGTRERVSAFLARRRAH